MRVLVLGGTVYVGRAIAEHFREAGHQVTCAARGASGGVPLKTVFKKIDRDDPSTLSALDGDFDVAVDVTRLPRHAESAVGALNDRVGRWIFVSSCSAYADQSTPGLSSEDSALLAPAPPDADESDRETYGARKVACELAYPPDSFLCRPGLIIGPGDPGNRFDYWVSRLDAGGEIAVPGSPGDLVQFIDVRDLCDWLVRAAETGLDGGLDAIAEPITRASMLDQIAATIGVTPQLTWIDQDFLAALGIEPWSGPRSLPMFMPQPMWGGLMARDPAPSFKAGLTIRSFEDTVRAVHAWLPTAPPRIPPKAGLTPAEESVLLAEWHNRPTTRPR